MKKKKVGFWQKVRNIYNDSPWLAAFVYPIIYIIVAGILSSAFLMLGVSHVLSKQIQSFMAIIGAVFALSIYLTPIWVFVGLIISKKKLPYILSLLLGLFFLAIFIYVVWMMSSYQN